MTTLVETIAENPSMVAENPSMVWPIILIILAMRS